MKRCGISDQGFQRLARAVQGQSQNNQLTTTQRLDYLVSPKVDGGNPETVGVLYEISNGGHIFYDLALNKYKCVTPDGDIFDPFDPAADENLSQSYANALSSSDYTSYGYLDETEQQEFNSVMGTSYEIIDIPTEWM